MAWQKDSRGDRPRPTTTGSSSSRCGASCPILSRDKPICFPVHRRLWTPRQTESSSPTDALLSPCRRSSIVSSRTRPSRRRCFQLTNTRKSKKTSPPPSIFIVGWRHYRRLVLRQMTEIFEMSKRKATISKRPLGLEILSHRGWRSLTSTF